MNIRKRFALWLCRAAGLTDVAVHRAELDDLRESTAQFKQALEMQLALTRRSVEQLNANTLMMKRWLDASPALQTIERAHANRPKNGKRSSIILPPSADLRANIPETIVDGSRSFLRG
jgi:hypothetical protein